MDRVAVSVPHGATWGTGRGFSMRTAGRRPGLSIQNVLWGWNVLSRISPSKAETTCCNCNCNKRPRARPGKCTGLGSAAASGLPRPGSRPHRTVPARRSVDAPRTTGAHIHLSQPCARACASHAGREDSGHGRHGAARRLGAPYVHQTITRKRSQRIDRSSSELSRRARSLCTVRVRGSLPLLDAVSWYQVTVSGLAAGPADVRPRRAPGDRQRT